jgi:hypothetical protein
MIRSSAFNDFNFSTFRSSTMFNKFAFVVGLVLANSAFAAGSDNVAVVTDKDDVMMVAAVGNTWSVVAMDNTNGMSKVRKFFDLGENGVQQIDYVVNCADQSVALAGFAVLKTADTNHARLTEPNYDDLTFYKPKLDIDRNIANNVCDKRVAMSNNGSTN